MLFAAKQFVNSFIDKRPYRLTNHRVQNFPHHRRPRYTKKFSVNLFTCHASGNITQYIFNIIAAAIFTAAHTINYAKVNTEDSSQKMPPGSLKTRTQKRPAFFREKLHNQQRRNRKGDNGITKRLPIPAVLVTDQINVKHGENNVKGNVPSKTVIFRHDENHTDESCRQQNRRGRAQKRQFFPTQSFSPFLKVSQRDTTELTFQFPTKKHMSATEEADKHR